MFLQGMWPDRQRTGRKRQPFSVQPMEGFSMEELREAVERFFVSQTEAADTFGISVGSMHRYINRGGVPIPLAILVTLLLKGEISVNDILKTGQSPFKRHWEEEADLERRLHLPPVESSPLR
jgi:hypothetical protein